LVLMAVLLLLQVYILQFQWWFAVAYNVPAIIIPLGIIFLKLKNSYTTAHFHTLSTYAKLVMLTGILSMIFFYIYL
jgi:hypothetical protein